MFGHPITSGYRLKSLFCYIKNSLSRGKTQTLPKPKLREVGSQTISSRKQSRTTGRKSPNEATLKVRPQSAPTQSRGLLKIEVHRKNISATIVSDVKRFCRQLKTDEVLGTHTTNILHAPGL
jgi:hypothetical protein